MLFRAVYGMLETASRFSLLPISSLDRLSLQGRLRRSAVSAKAPRFPKKHERPGSFDLRRQLVAEALGTAFLLATVVGSGIMAERLAGGNVGLALLCNTIPTGAILVVIILMFGPVSGAHFNPAVTFAFLLRREIGWAWPRLSSPPRSSGGLVGTWPAHLMFDVPILMLSAKLRTGAGQWSGEFVATFGLVGTILACLRFRKEAIPYAVGLYITAAYWFTARPRSPIRR